jgi:hypothetical protein
MQQFLKSASRIAQAQIVATEFFGQFNVAVDETPPAFAMSFRGE